MANNENRRIVYTCQKDHQSRCKFFLWDSDAEAREKLAVLSNSRSEAATSFSATPHSQTPSSMTVSGQRTEEGAGIRTGLLTPQTGHRDTNSRKRKAPSPSNPHLQRTPHSAKAHMMSEDTDEFDWDGTIESEMGEMAKKSQPLRQPDFGLGSRKAPRTETASSPSERRRGSGPDLGIRGGNTAVGLTATPGSNYTAMRSPPFATPTPKRYKNAAGVAESPLASGEDLSGQVSAILDGHGVVVPRAAREELRELFGRHEMKMMGVIRGRDISRIALRKKDDEIARLEGRIAGFEAQRTR